MPCGGGRTERAGDETKCRSRISWDGAARFQKQQKAHGTFPAAFCVGMTAIKNIRQKGRLKNVQPEMVAGMITPRRRIEIHPALVVGGHLHFGGIAVVRIGAALKILR